ncbi:cerberus [Nematostella vectensis]|uniref:cerberus n=1 Tax=Nematostella vectensis TaxID=45351 RepID=UPI0020774B64|nr:cerberus [Nematostella vectensis]
MEQKAEMALVFSALLLLSPHLPEAKSINELHSNSVDDQANRRLTHRLPIIPEKEGETKHIKAPETAEITENPGKYLPLKGGSTIMSLKLKRNDLRGDWCKLRPVLQKLHHPGCNSSFIMNNMCYGQCMSFFIPRHFTSCAFCTPVSKNVVSVHLKCAGDLKVVKKVSIIQSCSCRPCGNQYI